MRNFYLTLLALAFSVFCIAQTPVAWYPFTGNANDAVGTNHGTVNGATLTTDRFGNANSAYSFDGVDDKITTPISTTVTDNYTLSGWVKLNSTATNQILFYNGNSSLNGYGLYLGSNGILYVLHGGLNIYATSATLNTNQWYFLAMVRQSGNTKVYVNGVDVFSNATSTPNTLNDLFYMSGNTIGTELLNGYIDEVKIYNTALTAAQVLAEYSTNKLPPFTPVATMTTDGTTTFASTPAGMMQGASDFTIETWIKTTENKSNGTFFLRPTLIGNGRGQFADNDIAIFTNSGNIGMYSGLGSENVLQTAVPINDNIWHHIAAVKNGAVLNLYVDGINVGNTAVGASNTLTTSDAPITIGGAAFNFNVPGLNTVNISTFHQGEFAETRFSNTARYNANFTPANSFTTDANTVALYKYGACQREICTDASSNANFLSGRFSAPTCATGLPFTNAITYNGVDQGAFLPTGVMNGLTSFTIEGWIKSTDVTTSPTSEMWRAPWIFGKEMPSANSGDIMITTQAGYANFSEEFVGGGAYTETLTKYFISDNQWHHVAVSADGTTCRYFIDGILLGSKPIASGLQVSASDKFSLMNRTGTNESSHSGLLEEVRFSNSARYTGNFTPPTGIFTTDANTVALYHSDDCPNNTLVDASANNNMATLQNFSGTCQSVASQKPGSGNAISFDGTNQFVTIPNSPSLNFGTGNFSVEFWINSSDQTREILFQKRDDCNGGPTNNLWGIEKNAQGEISFEVNAPSVSIQIPNAIDGKWHHIFFTRTATELKGYKDGILIASIASSGVNVSNATDLKIGTGVCSPFYPGNGFPTATLDEVRLWNTSLSQAQIRDRMCQKITNSDALYPNLVAYYNFDESTGTTVFDGSASSNNGTLVNGPTRVTSGAAIGNSSAHNYVTTGLPAANLSINTQDNLAVAYTGGTFTGTAGTHIYAVTEAPNTTNGILGAGSKDRYFGVFNVNLTSPAYTATYNYSGNPTITNENGLALYKRTDNAGTTWSATGATLNTTANTLVTTGQNTEYILGEGVLTTYYQDADGDTYGNPGVSIQAFAAPDGYVANNTDCNDGDATIYPGAAEICDGNDNNCDGQIDNLNQTIVLRSGNGSIGQTDAAIKMLVGPDDTNFPQLLTASDFTAARNGTAPTIIQNHPAWISSLSADPLAKWINNTGSNGTGNTALFAIDFTLNGPVSAAEINFNYAIDNILGGGPNQGVYLNGQALSGSTTGGTFGSDFNITRNDIASLLVPGLNTLYVNATDQGSPGAVIFSATITTQSSCAPRTWYADADGDRYGDPLVFQTSFNQPTGYVLNNTDCNDANAAVNPGATEVCDGIDNNCDGSIDEGVIPTWFKDADNDGYSDGSSLSQCTQPAGHKLATQLNATSGDCNDNDATLNPAAAEVCDGVDNNCNGQIDEGVITTWFKDADSDGYSDGTSLQACSRPALFKPFTELIATSGDCDEASAAINPGATEVCDGIDNDCDGQTDEGLIITWFLDSDNDGYGTGATLVQCSRPTGYKLAAELTSTTGDCNDNNPNINPEAQTLTFSGNQGFTTSFVNPESGSPYTSFNFEVNYTDAANQMPPNGYPRVLLDFEGNGVFNNANDKLLVLSPTDVGDNITSNGKIYRGSINQLTPGNNWQSRIIVVNGTCSTSTTIHNYPIVKVLPDIEIYANDIQFSTPNPAVSSPLTVSATIHNVSDFDAQNFVVKLINQFDPSIDYGTITVDNINARSSRQISWNITTPSIPAWCPMQIVIDQTNVIDETNELNNTALRPFTNGNYDVPGVIVVNATASPSVSYPAPGSTVTVSGNAFYDDIAVPLADPSVAGAEVTFTVTETGQTFTGVTNSSGNFSISFFKPQVPGEYHITGSVTDFTLTGHFTTSFIIICLPDLAPSITLSANQIIEGQSLTAQFKVSNLGCLPAPATQLQVTQTGGTPAIPNINVPALAPGETFTGPTMPLLFATRGQYSISAVADAGQIIAEQNEGNNTATVFINVLPPLPDLLPVNGPHPGPYELCKAPTFTGFVLHNSGGIASGPFTTTVKVVLNGNVLETFNHPVANIAALGFYAFSVPYTYTNTGIYHFEVSVDVPLPNGLVDELREDNNYADYPVTIEPCKPANLILVAENCQRFTTLNPIDPAFPGTMVLTSRVSNVGSLPAVGPIKVRFSISNGSSYIGTYDGGLAPGETVSISVTVPTVPPATATLVTMVDPLGEVAESNEDDNTGPVENLCVNFSPIVYCGNSFTNGNYFINQGIQPSIEVAVGGLYYVSFVKVRFQVRGPGISGTINLGEGTIINPRPTCANACYPRAILPSTFVFTEEGEYIFTMTVDPDNEYTECSEADNVIVQTVRVSNKPDMRILSQYINPSLLNPDINEPVSLLVTYENIGSNNVNDRMKMKVLVDEIELSTVSNITGLVNGDKATISIPVPWSSSIVGAHIIRAIIDSDAEVEETGELNNEATRAIIVGPAANFRFLVFEPSKSFPAVGEAITINATIENNGLESANSEVVFMYIDNNGDTVVIGTIPVSLVAGGSRDIQLPWFVTQVPARLVARIQNSTVLETTLEDNVAINEIGQISIAVTATPACENLASGTLIAAVSGGKAPYTYEWSNGASEAQITAVPGTYQVTVTDDDGRIATGEGVIENRVALVYYPDADGDGYGNNADTIMRCSGVPVGYVNNNTDCNDADAAINPAATEICDGKDNDCDGTIDEGFAVGIWFTDADGDGYGTGTGQQFCNNPGAGFSTQGGDCNDADGTINPGATEICGNGKDDDCNPATSDVCTLPDADGDGVPDVDDCAPNNASFYRTGTFYIDRDGDGFDAGQEEVCYGESVPAGNKETTSGADCDDQDDQITIALTWYKDTDNDGYSDGTTLTQCARPEGYKLAGDLTATTGDCNDADGTINPGATEICGNGKDDDCNPATSDVCTLPDADGDGVPDVDDCAPNNASFYRTATFYIDRDGDGFDAGQEEVCYGESVPAGNKETTSGADCDDQDDQITTASSWFKDADNDGYSDGSTLTQCTQPAGYKLAGDLIATTGDCFDNNAKIYPGAPELCDGLDNNCNGQSDEGLNIGAVCTVGVGNCIRTGVIVCGPGGVPICSVTPGTPGVEVCNGLDDDCDGLIDEDVIPTWYKDTDNDGYSNGATLTQCARPTGYKLAGELTATTGDCNDNNAAVKPGATEVCNGIDDDCDGQVDEGVKPTWYKDTDNDGYSDGTTLTQCTQPTGYKLAGDLIATTGDCFDNNAKIYPGAPELCDGLDNNCNGQSDEGLNIGAVCTVGVGNCIRTGVIVCGPGGVPICSAVPGTPGVEVCNGLDDDCDGQVDEGCTEPKTWYRDGDKDGYGNPDPRYIKIQVARPNGYVDNNLDCKDWDNTVYPGAPELEDGKDNDCDGEVDEELDCREIWYLDGDNDGFGRSTTTRYSCIKPNNYVLVGGDCNDRDNTIFPDAPEQEDGKDNDCDGVVDDGLACLKPWYLDGDGDGYGRNTTTTIRMSCARPNSSYVDVGGDCNDRDNTIFPDAPELEDGKDNDCDGVIDDGLACLKPWYLDGDGDGYGRNTTTTIRMSCVRPNSSYVDVGGDCKDNDATINPGATEKCDGKDNDCDGKKDEDCIPIVSEGQKPANTAKPLAKADAPILEVSLWPNPARDVLMVSLDAFEPNKKLEMVLMQVDGKPLSVQSVIPAIKGQQVRFDVRAMAAGYYLLQVKQGGLSKSKRVIIAR